MKAAILAGVAVLAVAAPAAADNGVPWDTTTLGCVTKPEYRRADRGDWKSWIHEVWGSKGRQQSTYRGYTGRFETRRYKACSGGVVVVSYKDGRLQTKGAAW